MKTWFLCKVKYQKEDENGALKNVSEPYLLDAVSFTEAEARIYEKLGSTIRGEFYVTSINKSNIVDVFYYEDADIWHKVKITYYVAEESGKEKKITNYMLLTAHDVRQAYDRIFESLHNMLVTFKVPEIVETPIVEVFPFDSEDALINQAIPGNLKPLSEVEVTE
jgi:hypothetical protein